MNPGSAYLAILLLSAAAPFALTCAGPWRADGREWLRLAIAVSAAAVPFLLWDVAFTAQGHWGFNPRYVLGPGILGLPWEEIGFFLAIPFACLFIHRAVRGKPALALSPDLLRPLWLALAAGSAALAYAALDRPYSLAAFGVAAPLLAWIGLKAPAWSGRFLITLTLHYLPFLLVNGFLTALPVVTYSPDAIFGPRLGTIPVEDAAYSFSLLFLNVAFYERLHRAAAARNPRRPKGGRTGKASKPMPEPA